MNGVHRTANGIGYYDIVCIVLGIWVRYLGYFLLIIT